MHRWLVQTWIRQGPIDTLLEILQPETREKAFVPDSSGVLPKIVPGRNGRVWTVYRGLAEKALPSRYTGESPERTPTGTSYRLAVMVLPTISFSRSSRAVAELTT